MKDWEEGRNKEIDLIERRIESILNSVEILESQREILRKYDSYNKAISSKIKSRICCLNIMKAFCLDVKIPFDKVTKEDIITHFANNHNLKETSILNRKIQIKRFFKWFYQTKEYPDIVSWLKTIKIKTVKNPNEMLTDKELELLLDNCFCQRDRAIIMTLFESGCRVGELVGLSIEDVKFDEYGAKIHVNGKTGERNIRLINAVPDLKTWLDNHPYKNNPKAPLFVSVRNETVGDRLYSAGVRTMIKEAGKKADIKKKVYPHLLRHTRLTQLANDGLVESELRIIAGWSPSSDMPMVYLHPTEDSVDVKLLERSGIIKKKSETEESLKSRVCPFCKQMNSPIAKICNTCSDR